MGEGAQPLVEVRRVDVERGDLLPDELFKSRLRDRDAELRRLVEVALLPNWTDIKIPIPGL